MDNSIFNTGSVRKTYFNFAIPIVLSMVITIVYNITDTFFIALTNNTELVAGVSLCAPLFTMLMAFGNIFGQGGSSLVSRLYGQNDADSLHHVSAFCFYTAIATGILLTILMLGFHASILSFMGADKNTVHYASSYYLWMALGAPLVLLSFVHSNLLRSEGKTKESMLGTIGGSLVNIVLDPILIFGFHLGAAGAAIATVLGYLFTDVFCLLIVLRSSRILSVNPHNYRIPKTFIKQILGIGLSAALSNITQSLCLILTNLSLYPYGNDKIAAMGIAQKVSMIAMLIIVGFSFGGAPLIGYYYGSGNHARFQELLRFVLKFLCGLSIIMSASLIILAPLSIRFFLKNPNLVNIGAQMLRAQVISTALMAIVLFGTVVFQAIGKTIPALLLSLSRQGAVFLIVLWIAVKIGGYTGILLTQPIADLLSAVLTVLLLKHYFIISEKPSTL